MGSWMEPSNLRKTFKFSVQDLPYLDLPYIAPKCIFMRSITILKAQILCTFYIHLFLSTQPSCVQSSLFLLCPWVLLLIYTFSQHLNPQTSPDKLRWLNLFLSFEHSDHTWSYHSVNSSIPKIDNVNYLNEKKFLIPLCWCSTIEQSFMHKRAFLDMVVRWEKING